MSESAYQIAKRMMAQNLAQQEADDRRRWGREVDELVRGDCRRRLALAQSSADNEAAIASLRRQSIGGSGPVVTDLKTGVVLSLSSLVARGVAFQT